MSERRRLGLVNLEVDREQSGHIEISARVTIQRPSDGEDLVLRVEEVPANCRRLSVEVDFVEPAEAGHPARCSSCRQVVELEDGEWPRWHVADWGLCYGGPA